MLTKEASYQGYFCQKIIILTGADVIRCFATLNMTEFP
jgi:hypothetical protein